MTGAILSEAELEEIARFVTQTEAARAHLGEDFPVGAEHRAVWRDGRTALADATPRLLHHISALTAQLAEARETLEPFATRDTSSYADDLSFAIGAAFLVRDLRRAAAVHRALSSPAPKEKT